METIKISRDTYSTLFGGLGFHNNDATMYHVMDKEHFNQIICKNYREISPGFMRTFAGFSDWTKEAMDEFAEYYEKMQKWTDTPMYITPGVAKAHFNDEDMRNYCDAVAEKLAYLYYEKNVKHLRYYCFSNELSQGMYGALNNDLPLFKKYHQMLFEAFQRRNLPIGLLATDATEYENWSTIEWARDNMAKITEDYCVHIYEREHDIYNLEFYDFFKEKCAPIVKTAIHHFGKRIILGEVGLQKGKGQITFNGGGAVIDTNRYFWDPTEEAYCGLMLTEMAFAAINAGVFALAYWSFCDHPDPYSCAYSSGDDEYARKWGEAERFFSGTTDSKYNKCGFTKWDDFNKDYGARAHYWCIAPLVKLFKRNSMVLTLDCKNPLLRCCGILNRDGSVSVGIVNRSKHSEEIRLESEFFKKPIRVYEYDPQNVPFNKFCDLQDYNTVLDEAQAVYSLKPESVTFFTTDYKLKEKRLYADGLAVSADKLAWNSTNDSEHCYWRVFASEKRDFEPSKANQIASTVANELPIESSALYYKVVSVDKSGNM